MVLAVPKCHSNEAPISHNAVSGFFAAGCTRLCTCCRSEDDILDCVRRALVVVQAPSRPLIIDFVNCMQKSKSRQQAPKGFDDGVR